MSSYSLNDDVPWQIVSLRNYLHWGFKEKLRFNRSLQGTSGFFHGHFIHIHMSFDHPKKRDFYHGIGNIGGPKKNWDGINRLQIGNEANQLDRLSGKICVFLNGFLI